MGKKPDYVFDNIYQSHLTGGKFNSTTSEITQAILETNYLRILTEMCVNRFKWTGLPSTINDRFLEMTLFRSALSVFFFDDTYSKFFALQGAGQGPLNQYWDPASFIVVGNSEFNSKILSAMTDATTDVDEHGELDVAGKCVPIWANMTRTPELATVTLYAKRLANMDLTIDIATRNARRSRVIVADENERLTATNINNSIDRGDSFIAVNSRGFELMQNIAAFDMGVHPDHVVKLFEARQKLWNECMGLLGLNFANQEKRERMVVDEVSANDEQVGNMKHVHLNERKHACRLINAKYGLHIDVDFRVQLPWADFGTDGEL